MKQKIICFTDGSIRYNPHGEMGYGYIIDIPDMEVIKYAGHVPEKQGNSSNLAEYIGLEALLLRLIELKLATEEVIVYTDSDLIYKQINRGVPIRHGFYKQKAYEVRRLLKRFKNLKIEWISRSANSEADALASEYLGKKAA